ncbi:ribbon-helix-helix protein, CopG family [Nakamurella sp. UYEF19]|uniref:CopG family ribbon-helix-helix protein n=1 Tax=Nakamurella sp. UYEF19 TaxID=1756392 RepID=UPI0033970709
MVRPSWRNCCGVGRAFIQTPDRGSTPGCSRCGCRGAQNQQLAALAASEGRSPSDLMREAVAEYLATHRTG